MSDMKAALDAARTRLTNGGNTAPTLNSTPSSSSRYSAPIATAHASGLPIIDISPFLSPTSTKEARQTTASAINAACINYGFFYLTGHGIPISKLDDIISLAREFFDLDATEKNKIKRHDAGGPEGGDGARGYQGLGENVTGGLQDMQEAIDLYAEWPESKREEGDAGPGSVKTLQGANLWPERPEKLKETYLSYIEDVKRVGEALVHAMGVALDLGPPSNKPSIDGDIAESEDEEIFKRACKDSFWVLRMIAYPPLPASHRTATKAQSSSLPSSSKDADEKGREIEEEEEEDVSQFSCGAHTDYGCVTLLLSDPTPNALHVQLKDGTWLPANPIPGHFVVNIGDMIERWTNGVWKSTLHRVIHRADGGGSAEGAEAAGENGSKKGRSRISVPFFFEPGFDAVVKPLEKCVEMQGGRKVVEGEGTYGEHLLTKVFNNFYFSKRTEW